VTAKVSMYGLHTIVSITTGQPVEDSCATCTGNRGVFFSQTQSFAYEGAQPGGMKTVMLIISHVLQYRDGTADGGLESGKSTIDQTVRDASHHIP
jgi:hypothetical protein